MKWYYKWRLNKVRAEISALKKSTQTRLVEDYTGHSRLRVLSRMEDSLRQRLDRYADESPRNAPQDTGDLKQTL